MNINKNNYEEFFMMYADNELSAAERKAVEAFVAANPGMQEELDMFQQFKLAPDNATVFTNKEALLKNEPGASAISLTNYESFFVLYADDELTTHEKVAVEDFVCRHPQVQAAFELIQQVKLQPDASVVFNNKESLYRKERDERVVVIRWWQMAAAALVLLTAAIFWLIKTNKTEPATPFVKNTPAVTNPQQPSLYKQEEQKKEQVTNSDQQPVNETLAKQDADNNNRQLNHQPAISNKTINVRKKTETIAQGHVESPVPFIKEEEAVARVEEKSIQPSSVAAVQKDTRKPATINTAIAAAVSKSVTDQQLSYSNSDENDKIAVTQAVAINADELEVLNTSVNTKNSLRGFFRKASRLIAKKTSNGDEEKDSKHKSILIGGFEIAVR